MPTLSGMLVVPRKFSNCNRFTFTISLLSASEEALRSIIISQRFLGTKEIVVIHHTGCGMLLFTSGVLRKLVKDAEPGDLSVAEAVDKINFLEFGNLEDSVRSDVKFLQENPLVVKDTTITGWIYDTKSGKVNDLSLCLASDAHSYEQINQVV
jgi:carbonic anhydrase